MATLFDSDVAKLLTNPDTDGRRFFKPEHWEYLERAMEARLGPSNAAQWVLDVATTTDNLPLDTNEPDVLEDHHQLIHNTLKLFAKHKLWEHFDINAWLKPRIGWASGIVEWLDVLAQEGADLSKISDHNRAWFWIGALSAREYSLAPTLIKHHLLPPLEMGKHGSWQKADPKGCVVEWCESPASALVLNALPATEWKKLATHKNSLGQTALHHACRYVLGDLVETLLKHGADPTVMDKKGLAPFDLMKSKTKRVDQASKIHELLGRHTNKTPEELVLQGIKTLDVALIKQAEHLNPLVVATMDQKGKLLNMVARNVERTDTTMLKKLRPRQTATFMHLYPSCSKDHSDHEGNNVLHVAIKNGALGCIKLILENNPELSQVHNNYQQLPADLRPQYFDKEYAYFTDGQYTRSLGTLATEEKILNVFLEHNCVIADSNFPTLKTDPKRWAKAQRAIIKQELGEKGSLNIKKKM